MQDQRSGDVVRIESPSKNIIIIIIILQLSRFKSYLVHTVFNSKSVSFQMDVCPSDGQKGSACCLHAAEQRFLTSRSVLHNKVCCGTSSSSSYRCFIDECLGSTCSILVMSQRPMVLPNVCGWTLREPPPLLPFTWPSRCLTSPAQTDTSLQVSQIKSIFAAWDNLLLLLLFKKVTP